MADPTLVVRVAANLSEMKANLTEGVSQIETYSSALKSASAAFDGSRIVSQASAAAAAIQNAGGVTALTSAEMTRANALFTDAAAKLQLMGQGGSYSAQQFAALAASTKQADESLGGFSEQFTALGERIVERLAIYELLRVAFDTVKGSLDLGAELEHMAVSVGINTDELQKLTYAGQQYGVTSDLMVRATETLSAKLANGDGNLTKAFASLGLSVSDFRAMSPNEAMLSLADAVGQVGDPMQRAGDMAQIFGMRLSRELIPAMADLRKAESAMPDAALIPPEDIEAAHQFEIALANAKTEVEAGTLSFIMFIAQIAGLTSATAGLLDVEKKHQAVMNEITNIENDASLGAGILSTSALALTAHLQSLTQDALFPLSDATKTYIANARDMHGSADEIAAAIHLPLDAITAYMKTLDDADAKQATWAAAWNTVRAAIEPTSVSLVGLSQHTIDSAEAALAAGVSQKVVADAFNLSDEVVKKLAADVKEHTAAMKLDAAQSEELSKLQAQYDATAIERTGTVTATEIAKINEKYTILWAALEKTGKLSDEVATQIDANWAQALNGVGVDWNALKNDSINALQDIYTRAQATFVAMASDGLVHSQAQIQHFRDLRDAALDALHDIPPGQAAIDSAFDATNAKILGMVDSFHGWNDAVMGATVSTKDAAGAAKQLKDSIDAAALSTMGESEADAALNDQLGSTIKNVRTLAGEYLTAADAKKRFDQGGSMDVTSQNFAQALDQTITATYGSPGSGIYSEHGLIGREAQASDLASKGYSFAEIVAFLEGGTLAKAPIGPRIPGYASGVADAPGGLAMVGERGPEVMYVPPHASIYPSGTGPGGGVHSVTFAAGAIVLQFPIMNNPRAMQELVGVLGDGIMAKLRGAGLRLPSGV